MSWDYELRKSDLEELLSVYGIESTRTRNELREKLKKYIKDNPEVGEEIREAWQRNEERIKTEELRKDSEARNEDSEDEEISIINSCEEKVEIKEEMATAKMTLKPGMLDGKGIEQVRVFLKRYELCAKINQWNEQQKVDVFPAFLEAKAMDKFEEVLTKGAIHNWDDLKRRYMKEFEGACDKNIMEARMINRKQEEDESADDYVTDKIKLCKEIDNNMTEEEICRHIIRGLNPEATRYVTMFKNDKIDKLKEHMKRYELGEYLRANRKCKNNLEEKVEQLEFKLNQIKVNELINKQIEQLEVAESTTQEKLNALPEQSKR